jgi:hypothetical protein
MVAAPRASHRSDDGGNDKVTCEVSHGSGDRYDAGYRFTIN